MKTKVPRKNTRPGPKKTALKYGSARKASSARESAIRLRNVALNRGANETTITQKSGDSEASRGITAVVTVEEPVKVDAAALLNRDVLVVNPPQFNEKLSDSDYGVITGIIPHHSTIAGPGQVRRAERNMETITYSQPSFSYLPGSAVHTRYEKQRKIDESSFLLDRVNTAMETLLTSGSDDYETYADRILDCFEKKDKASLISILEALEA